MASEMNDEIETRANQGDCPARPKAMGRPDQTTVLLVEDDPSVRELTREALNALGCQVLTADSEAQAVWLWQKYHTDITLLLTDVMIPTCATGIELAQRFQRQKPDLRILFTSGFGRSIGEEDGVLFAHSAFLAKPYTVGVLQRAVAACLEEG